jgi:GAF domain-containing protein
MMEQPVKWRDVLVNRFHRLVAIETEDEETARLGILFNTLMLLSLAFSGLFFSTYLLAYQRAWITSPRDFWLQGIFALMFIPLAIFCFWQSKRGNVHSTFALYIWLCMLGVSLAIFLFDGIRSPLWLLYFWPIALAGTFLSPFLVLIMVVWGLAYYGLLFFLDRTGGYSAIVAQSAELYWFTGQALTLMLLTAVPGILSYLNTNSMRVMLDRLLGTTQTLEGARQELEERVNARTAVLQTRAEQFQAIAELSHAASSIRDLQDLLDTTVRLIAERLGFYHVGIFLIGAAGEWAVLQAASSEGGQQMLARGHRLRVGQEGIVGYVSSTGLPRFAFSVGEDAVWFNNPDLPDTQSEMALPLNARERTIGVLDIQTIEEAAFTEEDVAVLHILADSIAVAIANTRSYEEAQDSLARLSRYQEQDALAAWRQALERRNMQVSYAYLSGIVTRTDSEEMATTAEWRDVSDVSTRINELGQHVLLAPVSIRGQQLGVLSFEQLKPWTDEQVQLTRFVIEQLELALDNARLLEETDLRANQQRARSEIMARVRVLGSTDAIMRGAVEELGRALQVERSRIQLLPPGEDEV